MATAVVACPDPSTKASNCLDNLVKGLGLEVRIHLQGCSIFTLFSPKALPLVGSSRHTSTGNGLVSKTEITSVINFGFKTKMFQHAPCGIVKCCAKRVRNCKSVGQFHRCLALNDREGMSAMLFYLPATCIVVMGTAWQMRWHRASARTRRAAITEFWRHSCRP